MAPPRNLPGGLGTSLKIEVAVTLLPQPDSPTSPSVRPFSIESETPSTAWTRPASVSNPTARLSISSSDIGRYRSPCIRGRGRSRPVSRRAWGYLHQLRKACLLGKLANVVIVLVQLRIDGIGLVGALGFFERRLFRGIDPID